MVIEARQCSSFSVVAPLSNVLRENETTEEILRESLLNDPFIVSVFRDAELDIGRYLADGMNIYRGALCKNRTLGGTILLKKPEVEAKVSEMLCRLDYTRFIHALDEAIDVEKLLSEIMKRDSEGNQTFGQLLKQIASDTSSGNCEKCELRMNGTELLAEIADLSKHSEWPELKKRIVAALKAAEEAGDGTAMEHQLSEYRRNVDSVSALLKANGRSQKRLEKGENEMTV